MDTSSVTFKSGDFSVKDKLCHNENNHSILSCCLELATVSMRLVLDIAEANGESFIWDLSLGIFAHICLFIVKFIA